MVWIIKKSHKNPKTKKKKPKKKKKNNLWDMVNPTQLKLFMNLHESSWNMMKKSPNNSSYFMKFHETSWIFMKMTDVKMTQMGLVKVHEVSWIFLRTISYGVFPRVDSISCNHLGISCLVHRKEKQGSPFLYGKLMSFNGSRNSKFVRFGTLSSNMDT